MDDALPTGDWMGQRVFWAVGLVSLVLALATNLPWQLDDYDQAKQAFTSFEMVKQGHWLYQHTPRTRVATKPPLVGWISAGLFEVTRSWDLAWRLPSLAAAVALGICLSRAATAAYGASGGLAALAGFCLNLLTPRLATLVRTDMPLALVLGLTGLLIWSKIRSGAKWQRRDRVRMAVLLTAGMLIKGPIVYAFLLPGILGFQWWRRKKDSGSAWSGWWPWIVSLAIFLGWAIGGIQFVPGFYDQVVVREFLGRFGETIHRPQPLYFYFPHLLHKFAPWSVLMLVLAWLGWRSRRAASGERARLISPDTMWLICWSLGGLLVMSCVPSKRVDRIFPVIPPLCLLLAAQLARFRPDDRPRLRARQWILGLVAVAVVFTSGYTAFKVVSGYHEHRGALEVFGRAVRAQAAANGWRYGAIAGSDEGMILYLNQTQFEEPEVAIEKWNAGKLDALVLPANRAEQYVQRLTAAAVRLRSAEPNEEGSGYVLLVRKAPSADIK